MRLTLWLVLAFAPLASAEVDRRTLNDAATAEIAPTDILFSDPIHAYTRALLSAIPIPDPMVKRERVLLKGETPVLTGDWKGCTLQDRCPEATLACREEYQHMRDVGGGHLVACRLAD